MIRLGLLSIGRVCIAYSVGTSERVHFAQSACLGISCGQKKEGFMQYPSDMIVDI